MINVAILGSGNIGTDLLFKLRRSKRLNPVWMVGIVATSPGLAIAAQQGLKTTHDGIDGLLQHLDADKIQVVFDATSAKAHLRHHELLSGRGIRLVDLTPAALGPYCIPPVNLHEHMDAPNVNMVSCGGQATIPMVWAVSRVQPVAYAEIVATVASKSIGPGTRANIDEFTRTTRAGIEAVGGAAKGKAIIVINPADPPIVMRDTIHCLTQDVPDQSAITDSIHLMIESVKRYVPGYTLTNGPVFDGKRVSVWLEVAGLGDYLQTYAGNLDIMTSAALATGELIAEHLS